MEGSCTDDGSTTRSTSDAASRGLHRMGSGASASASVILDPTDQQADSSSTSKKLPSSKYKGVVPQPNGRWGAQIYEKHTRVWLGTFNTEHDAARSYDVAAHRFRGRDAVLNSPTPLSDPLELSFLSSHSKPEIVDMLRKHTYSDELRQSRRLSRLHPGPTPPKPTRSDTNIHPLFEKTVTPSDVGKLNRLVIPKQHAEKHFPLGGDGKGVLLNFEDGNEKVWRFRYSYWNSSQSYVLTKGWSRFVKDKCLKAGDVVAFLRSTGETQQLYIECRAKTTSSLTTSAVTASIRLFGVDIDSKEKGDGDGDGDGDGKRGRGDGVVLDLVLSLGYSNNKRMRMVTRELS